MVRFLTLFVGLVTGHQQLELAVSGPVARVELRLNHAALATLHGPPWVARCDFGDELHPGLLEAVAFDVSGAVVDRDERWVNLPTDRAEAAILPVTDDRGALVGARITWHSPEFGRPRRVRATLDSRPLAVSDAFQVDLGSAAADQLHLLTVELVFSDEVVVRRELAFGAPFAGHHATELTALPVMLEGVEELPPIAGMAGWFQVAGRPLTAVAAESGPAQLIVVADPGAGRMVEELFQARKKGERRSRRGDGEQGAADDIGAAVEVRVLIPEPLEPVDRGQPTRLFPLSREALPGSEGVLKAVVAARTEKVLGAGLMLGDAVAMAGVKAAEGNRRRAVLVLAGPAREDISRVQPEAARQFLRDLHVPLAVWDLSGERGSPPAGWQADRQILRVDDLRRATRRLRATLERQRIVWLDGRHLPQELGLSDAVRDLQPVR